MHCRRGCKIFKPNGFAVPEAKLLLALQQMTRDVLRWEGIQRLLDPKIKAWNQSTQKKLSAIGLVKGLQAYCTFFVGSQHSFLGFMKLDQEMGVQNAYFPLLIPVLALSGIGRPLDAKY